MTRGVAGPEIALCGAVRRRDDDGERVAPGEGALCTRPAGWGTATPGVGRCKLHAGSTPAAAAGAALRRVESECQALLGEYDIGAVDNPIEELSRLAGQVVGWKNLLADRVAGLRADEWRRADRLGEETRAELVLLERALDRAARLLVDMSKLGIAGRRLQLEEQKVDFMVAIVETYIRNRGEDPHHTDVRSQLYTIAGELEERFS